MYGRDNLYINNFKDAHQYCSKFLKFNSDHELAYIKLAESLIGLEKYDEAFDYLNKAEKINKNKGMDKENYLFQISQVV